MKTIAVIGAGALAHVFCSHFKEALGEDARISGVFSRTAQKASELAASCGAKPYETLEALIADKPDFAVEFAGVAALKAHAVPVLRSGISLIAVSAGALADDAFRAEALKAAREGNSRLVIPSGAIGALDLLQAYSLIGGAELEFESRKAPKSLNGAAGLGGRLLSETEEEIAFSGSIPEAIKGFPKNVNVAVAAAAASGAKNAHMTLRSVPGAKETTHAFRIRNSFMHAEVTISASPDPENPRSSTSTAWSVLALLRNLTSPLAFY